VGSSSGGTELSDTTAQATISPISPPRMSWAFRISAWARSGGSGSADHPANSAETSSPTGVAIVKP
jgi:hypothetical protein